MRVLLSYHQHQYFLHILMNMKTSDCIRSNVVLFFSTTPTTAVLVCQKETRKWGLLCQKGARTRTCAGHSKIIRTFSFLKKSLLERKGQTLVQLARIREERGTKRKEAQSGTKRHKEVVAQRLSNWSPSIYFIGHEFTMDRSKVYLKLSTYYLSGINLITVSGVLSIAWPWPWTMNHEPWHIVPCTIANCDLRFPSPTTTRILHYTIDNVVSFVHDCIISGLQCAGQHRQCATQGMTTSVQFIIGQSTSMMTYWLLDGNTTYIIYLSLLLLLLSLSDNRGIIMPMLVLWSTHAHPSCHGRYKRATNVAQSGTKRRKAALSSAKRH